jgi:hypothetical protein
MIKAAQIIRRLTKLKSDRSPLESIWRDCYLVTNPVRAHGLEGEVMDGTSLPNAKARIMDGVTGDATRTLSSQMASGLHPSNAQWFELEIHNSTEDEKRWLSDAAELVYKNIHASNFDAESFEALTDAIIAGWFVLYIDEDKERGGLVFQQWPIAQCYVTSTRPDGRIDTILREYSLTANQCIAEFGESNVSEKVRKLVADEKGDDHVKLAIEVRPRDMGYKSGAKNAREFPFSSCTVETENKHVCRESGYHEFPCTIPRWVKVPESMYGVGPVLDALPDAMMLNTMKRFHLANAELNVAGMWIAEDDGVLNPRSIKVGPRKIIVANSVDSMKPLNPPGNWQLAQEEIKLAQSAIRKILMADQLQPQDGPAMTATEVHVRQQLIRQLLGPVFGRFQSEYLQPMIERVFGILFRAGVFPAPPQTLRGKEYKVKYISPLARAQKMEDVSSIERMLGTIGAVAQMKPEVLDLLDGDEIVRVMAEALGVPTEIIKKKDAVEAEREERAEAQQQAQQQAMMAEMATRAAPQIAQGMMQQNAA